jgi:N4-gp56 family major capsid protein
MGQTNQSSTFAADIENYIQKKTLPLVQRQLVLYQFGQQLRLEKNRGTTYTASRYDRVNLPFAPLSEGVPPTGEQMTLVQVSATAQQWGDTITVTDVADMTIKHPLFQTAIKLIAMQMSETLERNTANNLLAGSQINYVNSRGSRAALVAGDVLNTHEVNRAVGALRTIGAPEYNGQREEDAKVTAGKPSMASKDPRGFQHYVGVMHTLVEQDLGENPSIVLAWTYSDINRLYNNEVGAWRGVRWTRSNMVPYFVGNTTTTGTGATTGGALAAASYYLIWTGSVAQNGYEQQIYQVSSAITVGGSGNGSITTTTPNVPGYTWNVYIGTSTTPTNLGVTASGPTSGPLAGQAVSIPSNTAVTITGVGVSRTPPAAPANGVTVFPSFIFGEDSYGQVMLDDPKMTYLQTADKSDPLNQLRIVGWKVFYGTIILNQNFFMRIESTSAFTATFG